jgi:hypothetical protein
MPMTMSGGPASEGVNCERCKRVGTCWGGHAIAIMAQKQSRSRQLEGADAPDKERDAEERRRPDADSKTAGHEGNADRGESC